MAITVNSGFVRGQQLLVPMLVDSATSDISVGDFVTEGTAGYVQQAAAGELPIGIAAEAVSSPSADGDVEILVDVSCLAVYRRSPDTGTVTQALVGRTMDIGGAQSIDIDASTDDCIVCVGVNTTDNNLDIMLAPDVAKRFAGVV